MRTFCILGSLVAVLVLIVGAGFYLNYFDVRTTTSPDNARTEIRLTVDKQKVQEDVQAIREKAEKLENDVKAKAGELKEEAKTLVFGPSVQGVIVEIDAVQRTVTVMNEEQLDPVIFRISAETQIHVDGKTATLADLTMGDPVTVVQAAEPNAAIARSVTVSRS